MNYELLPYLKNVAIEGAKSFSVLDKSLSEGFPPGLYVFGAFVTESDGDPWAVDQWIHLDYDVFEIR